MAKKCKYCGFENNPDRANYCGKCGKNIALYDHVWKMYDSTVYSTYWYAGNSIVSDYKLREYKEYENKINNSIWYKSIKFLSKIGKGIKGFWEGIKEGIKEDEDKWEWLFIPISILLAIIIGLFKDCSGDTRKLTRIEIDGKYGIGYSADDLLVRAIYDSIGSYPVGNQWRLFNKQSGLQGIAYVTDSVQNFIPIEYEFIEMDKDRAILAKNLDSKSMCYLADKGRIVHSEPFASITYPLNLGNAKIYVVTDSNDDYYMIDSKGSRLYDRYSKIKFSEDSVIIATNKIKTHPYTVHYLYDYDGNRLIDKTFSSIRDFSSGVAWCEITKDDVNNGKWTVIDNHGKVLFHRYPKGGIIKDFNEDIGWWKSGTGSMSKYTAVTKQGADLFEISAWAVYPFTMGIAPVYQGASYSNRKLGFVDATGKTVIPFKYEASGYNIKFDRDSTMVVMLEGIKGRLHRNGKFTPL